MPNQRHAEQQGLEAELLEPSLVAESRGPQTELAEPPRVPIDERRDAEFLSEASQLTNSRGALVQIDKVDLDPPLGEEAQRGPRVGAFPDAKDLYFHVTNAAAS